MPSKYLPINCKQLNQTHTNLTPGDYPTFKLSPNIQYEFLEPELIAWK